MANVLTALGSSAWALKAFNQALQTTQNNVANASTPGYVRHSQTLAAMSFDPAGGLAGGVRAGEIVSARSIYSDQAVRSQLFELGRAQQDVSNTSALQSIFDVSGDSGIPNALNQLFQSFSAWGQSPSDTVARQNVIEQSANVAAAFRQTARSLTDLERRTEEAASQTVTAVNNLAARLQTLNSLARRGSRTDSGLDAQIHNTLDELSQYVNITVLEQEDGSVDVILNGQTALVAGDAMFPVSCRLVQSDDPDAPYPDGAPTLHLYAFDGKDITAQTESGQLGSLLDTRNRILPSYLGDASQQGELNRMAVAFADRVNALLTSGTAPDGTPGVALFTYGTNPAAAAETLAIDETVQASQLGALVVGPPQVANGVPLALAALATPQTAADEIDGASYAEFFGRLGSIAGSEYNDAEARLQVQQSAVAQAKNLRQEMSGVSLDEEASILIQFQRAYEANARMVSVLDQLAQVTIDILRR